MAAYKITGRYRGRAEELDTADTLKEAETLVSEYRMAFGPEWSISFAQTRGGANQYTDVDGE